MRMARTYVLIAPLKRDQGLLTTSKNSGYLQSKRCIRRLDYELDYLQGSLLNNKRATIPLWRRNSAGEDGLKVVLWVSLEISMVLNQKQLFRWPKEVVIGVPANYCGGGRTFAL